MQYRPKGTKQGFPSACTAVPHPVLHTPSPYCTPLTCTTHTLYRVIMNEDQCLCYNQGATLGPIKELHTVAGQVPVNVQCLLKKLLPLHSNISDWSITGRSLCFSHCHMGYSFLSPGCYEAYYTEGRRRLLSGERK